MYRCLMLLASMGRGNDQNVRAARLPRAQGANNLERDMGHAGARRVSAAAHGWFTQRLNKRDLNEIRALRDGLS